MPTDKAWAPSEHAMPTYLKRSQSFFGALGAQSWSRSLSPDHVPWHLVPSSATVNATASATASATAWVTARPTAGATASATASATVDATASAIVIATVAVSANEPIVSANTQWSTHRTARKRVQGPAAELECTGRVDERPEVFDDVAAGPALRAIPCGH